MHHNRNRPFRQFRTSNADTNTYGRADNIADVMPSDISEIKMSVGKRNLDSFQTDRSITRNLEYRDRKILKNIVNKAVMRTIPQTANENTFERALAPE